MLDINKIGTIIMKEIAKGALDGCDDESLDEVKRILGPKDGKERLEQGIIYVDCIDGMGNKSSYLDGGRGIRIKISERK